MRGKFASVGIAVMLAVMAANVSAQTTQTGASKTDAGAAAAKRTLDRGRYMLTIGSCNDCHTAGFGPRDGNVPEVEWLLGSGALGFNGPWGTTYAPNLRLLLANMSENRWVTYAKSLKTRPPMPWFNLNKWSDSDLRAFYRYVKSLGAAGESAQAYLPPAQAPTPPYIQWPAPPK